MMCNTFKEKEDKYLYTHIFGIRCARQEYVGCTDRRKNVEHVVLRGTMVDGKISRVHARCLYANQDINYDQKIEAYDRAS